MDYRILLITGTDYPVPDCTLTLHQPTIEEIGTIGELTFFTGVQTLVVNRNLLQMGESVPSDITNFHIFMTIMSQKETLDKKQAVLDVLALLIPSSKVVFTPQSMLIQIKGEIIVIDEINFEALQAAIIDIFCLKDSLSSGFNPANADADRIAKKIMSGRQKIAKEKGQGTGSIFTQYLSILSIGLHLSMLDLKKYTVYQVYDSMERLGLYIEYDIDMKTRLAGGTPNKQPENWMKNLH